MYFALITIWETVPMWNRKTLNPKPKNRFHKFILITLLHQPLEDYWIWLKSQKPMIVMLHLGTYFHNQLADLRIRQRIPNFVLRFSRFYDKKEIRNSLSDPVNSLQEIHNGAKKIKKSVLNLHSTRT